MSKQIIVIDRAEECECPSIMGSGKEPQLGTWHRGIWYRCPHGSTVRLAGADDYTEGLGLSAEDLEHAGGSPFPYGAAGDPQRGRAHKHFREAARRVRTALEAREGEKP